MILAFVSKLDLKMHYINIRAQNIKDSTFKIFEIILPSFWIKDKLSQACCFQESFLLTYISMEVILDMLFLTINNANI